MKAVVILSEGEGGRGNWVGLSKWGWLGERIRVQWLEDQGDWTEASRNWSMVWGGEEGFRLGLGWAELGVAGLTLVGISAVQKRG